MAHANTERKQPLDAKIAVFCQNEPISSFSNARVTASVLMGSPKNGYTA